MEAAAAEIAVPPGEKQWVNFEIPADTPLPQTGYVRLDLLPNARVVWHVAGAIEPGHVSAFEMAPGKMRRYSSGVTMAVRIDPPQACFSANNVISGQTRPHTSTNLWRSDPGQTMPQWLQLGWQDEQKISTVELTFAGHLLREYHAYAPFYRDPQCVRDYDIEIETDGAWHRILEIRGNYQRHRRHIMAAPVLARKLRVLMLATNGDASAAIYEIRTYE
jgi:hypothetical protein